MKTKSHIAVTNQLANRLENHWSEFLRVSQCEHNWQAYGHGYQCENCKYYTGQNHEINKLIFNDFIK